MLAGPDGWGRQIIKQEAGIPVGGDDEAEHRNRFKTIKDVAKIDSSAPYWWGTTNASHTAMTVDNGRNLAH